VLFLLSGRPPSAFGSRRLRVAWENQVDVAGPLKTLLEGTLEPIAEDRLTAQQVTFPLLPWVCTRSMRCEAPGGGKHVLLCGSTRVRQTAARLCAMLCNAQSGTNGSPACVMLLQHVQALDVLDGKEVSRPSTSGRGQAAEREPDMSMVAGSRAWMDRPEVLVTPVPHEFLTPASLHLRLAGPRQLQAVSDSACSLLILLTSTHPCSRLLWMRKSLQNSASVNPTTSRCSCHSHRKRASANAGVQRSRHLTAAAAPMARRAEGGAAGLAPAHRHDRRRAVDRDPTRWFQRQHGVHRYDPVGNDMFVQLWHRLCTRYTPGAKFAPGAACVYHAAV
jgi:hypothetical protein